MPAPRSLVAPAPAPAPAPAAAATPAEAAVGGVSKSMARGVTGDGVAFGVGKDGRLKMALLESDEGVVAILFLLLVPVPVRVLLRLLPALPGVDCDLDDEADEADEDDSVAAGVVGGGVGAAPSAAAVEAAGRSGALPRDF